MVLTAFQQSVLHTAGSTRRADSRAAVSTLWHFCQHGHIHLSPWKPLGIHSFIFIASPGKFIPQEPCSHNSCPANLVPCTPCFDIGLFIHSSIHSQIALWAGPVQFTGLGTSVFPFWGAFSPGRNSQIWVHDFIHLMRNKLLLFDTGTIRRPPGAQRTSGSNGLFLCSSSSFWPRLTPRPLQRRQAPRKSLSPQWTIILPLLHPAQAALKACAVIFCLAACSMCGPLWKEVERSFLNLSWVDSISAQARKMQVGRRPGQAVLPRDFPAAAMAPEHFCCSGHKQLFSMLTAKPWASKGFNVSGLKLCPGLLLLLLLHHCLCLIIQGIC